MEFGPEKSYESKVEREKETFEELDTLMSQLIEQGVEWTQQKKQQARDKVKSLLNQLGVTGFDDPKYEEIATRIIMKEVNIKTPDGYPTQEEFSSIYQELLSKKVEIPEDECTNNPTLEEFISKAYTEWDKIRQRGSGETDEYLYKLGKILSDKFTYETLFPEDDELIVNNKWHIERGRHRALTLRCLGSEFVEEAKMNEYIKPVLEKD